MDTAAIGVLIGGFRQSQQAGVRFCVPNPHPFILRVLTVMGLAALLAVHSDAPTSAPADHP